MPDNFITLSKILGGIGGSLVSLAIIKPKTVFDALSRLLSSVILAAYLSSSTTELLGLNKTHEMQMAVAVGIGIFGWFIVSIVLNTIGGAKSIKDLKERFK